MAYFLRSSTPKARKSRMCDVCTQTIERGEIYHVVESVNEDGFHRFCMHSECDRATACLDAYDWECFEPDPRWREGIDPDLLPMGG